MWSENRVGDSGDTSSGNIAMDLEKISALRIEQLKADGFVIAQILYHPVTPYELVAINTPTAGGGEKTIFMPMPLPYEPEDKKRSDEADEEYKQLVKRYGSENVTTASPTKEIADSLNHKLTDESQLYMVRPATNT